MIDELYVLARLHELSRATAQLAFERKARAALSAAAPSATVPAPSAENAPCTAAQQLGVA